jgi:hypothetical protein
VRSRVTATLAAAVATTAALAGCGGGDDGPDARDFEGEWDVQMVVGAVEADPDAIVTVAAGDTFRERWKFDACDEQTCSMHRPEGGLVLGDLGDVPFEFVDSGSIDDTPRFTGRATATAVERVDPEPPPGEEDDHADEAPADAACAGSAVERWEVTIELDVREGVLSGTVLRIPEELVATVGGTECFGIDLTLGLSGTPADGSTDIPPG